MTRNMLRAHKKRQLARSRRTSAIENGSRSIKLDQRAPMNLALPFREVRNHDNYLRAQTLVIITTKNILPMSNLIATQYLRQATLTKSE